MEQVSGKLLRWPVPTVSLARDKSGRDKSGFKTLLSWSDDECAGSRNDLYECSYNHLFS